jgi:hypothetical protein
VRLETGAPPEPAAYGVLAVTNVCARRLHAELLVRDGGGVLTAHCGKVTAAVHTHPRADCAAAAARDTRACECWRQRWCTAASLYEDRAGITPRSFSFV